MLSGLPVCLSLLCPHAACAHIWWRTGDIARYVNTMVGGLGQTDMVPTLENRAGFGMRQHHTLLLIIC